MATALALSRDGSVVSASAGTLSRVGDRAGAESLLGELERSQPSNTQTYLRAAPFVVALKKDGQDDRTVANRVSGVITFLRAHGVVTVTLRHKYTEKKVKAYSVEELRALNAASTDEELQIWQFFLGTGFREDEVAHACDTDVDFKLKTIRVLEKRQWDWKPKDKEERTVPIPDSLAQSRSDSFRCRRT